MARPTVFAFYEPDICLLENFKCRVSLQSQTVCKFYDKIILQSTGKDSVIHGRNVLVWFQAEGRLALVREGTGWF